MTPFRWLVIALGFKETILRYRTVPFRNRSRIPVLAMIALFTAATIGSALADESVPAKERPLSTDSDKTVSPTGGDKNLRTYLQKALMIPEASRIQMGPRKRTSIDGLFLREVKLTNDQGHELLPSIFTDSSESQMLFAQGSFLTLDLHKSNSQQSDESQKTVALESAVLEHLKKVGMVPDSAEIQIGKRQNTAIRGLDFRKVLLSVNEGQTLSASLFTDDAENHLLLVAGPVEAFDLTKDPWQKVNLDAIHLEDRPVLGLPAAPVTIVEFADFQCPFCARAFGILEAMIRNKLEAQARLVYKSYTLHSHPWSSRAALAAECARLQNPEAFWGFARDFYISQDSISEDNLDAHISSTATQLGLDVSVLKTCMSGKMANDRVRQDQQDGDSLDITTTPTFYINGIQLIGMPDEKAFAWMIAQEASESEQKSRAAGR